MPSQRQVSVQIMKMWSKTLDLSPLLATSDRPLGSVQKKRRGAERNRLGLSGIGGVARYVLSGLGRL